MIEKNIIDAIRQKADMIKIVSEYVPLKKRGKNYLGLCPFHGEKTPSFTVSPDKQLFHCFGCKEGGNIFDFVMKTENIGFGEAVAFLGDKVGISVPKFQGDPAARSEREKLLTITKMAQAFFRQNLSEKAGEYLAKRGIKPETIDKFGLGFAQEGWDNLFKYLVAKGANPKNIEAAGLILARESSSGYYDRFRSRVMFPIFDVHGQVVGFSARALDDQEPKYLNSPDTLIFKKGEILFGLNFAKDEIKKQKTIVFVEGNLDLVTCHQAGLGNVVAPLGTALTASQAKLAARFAQTVILAYDADAAGGNAAERSAEVIRPLGLNLKIAVFSGGKDPDEVIRKHGANEFKRSLDSALPWLEFKIKRILGRYNLKEIEARAKAAKEIAGILSSESDQIVRKEYAKLAADLLKIDLESLTSEIYYKRSGNQRRESQVINKPKPRIDRAEETLLFMASQFPESLAAAKKELNPQAFARQETQKIAQALFGASGENIAHQVLDSLNDESSRKLYSALLLEDSGIDASSAVEITIDCIGVLKGLLQKERISRLKEQIKEAEKTKDAAKVSELLNLLKTEIPQSLTR